MALTNDILAASGLSQAELARRAGMPRSVVNAYVHGKREPGEKALLRLVAAGGLEVKLVCRKPPVDPSRASKLLVQVLELAEALPFRPKPELTYPPVAIRVLGET